MWRPLFTLFTAAFLWGCPGAPTPDAGTGGGRGGGSASGGGAGGSGGGVSLDECDFTGQRRCPNGQACTLAVRSDGLVAKRCIPGACDLVEQDCDAGLRCLIEDGGRSCIADGTLNEGQSCQGAAAGCRKGLGCALVGPDGGSACARFCREDSHCGAPQKCFVTLVFPSSPERPLICADPPTACSLLTQNCPLPGDGCYPSSGVGACFPAGNRMQGASCQFSNDCVQGLTCVGTGASARCRALCSIPTGVRNCADAGTCTRLEGFSDAGVCP